ncbi:ficolin-1-like [Drosophila albomicans]|uniref:Ficolin-1-like n=1 Tax=Drosophila albomicans TaxID=7291 RepID=A0A6P8XBK4_DROAB|nr:ficolin-1-like [Drosophila albomicans]
MRNFLTCILLTCLYQRVISNLHSEYADDLNCAVAKRLENQCASYCYQVIKPFIQITHECHQKDAKIADLIEQLAKYKAAESQNKELLEITANLVDIKEMISEMKTQLNKSHNVQENEHNTQNTLNSGLKMIKVPGLEVFPVLYNNHIAGPGWIVIQQRLNGDQSFYRDWAAYREGFGDITENGEFFIGLEKLHRMLSTNQPNELYIRMEHVNKIVRIAHYDNFNVGDEVSGYKLLSLGKHLGNSTDALRRNEKMKFTTFDRDNDAHISSNCAQIQNDGWWHAACSDSNLNGIYNDAKHCIYWNSAKLKTNGDCLTSVQILIKPKITLD